MSPINSDSSPHWRAQLAWRFMHLWFFKSTGTALFMVLFFYGYFALLKTPVFPVTLMPTTWIDDWLAFWPPAFYFYASLWVYTALVPALQDSFLKLIAYGCGIGTLCLTGLLTFLFFPTAVPFSASAPWFQDPTLSILRKIDLSGNAFPSLHVAAAVFTCMALHTLLREVRCPQWLKIVNWVWCLLIVYSTMAIKQHVMWDVVAGIFLGLVFGLLYSRLEKRLMQT